MTLKKQYAPRENKPHREATKTRIIAEHKRGNMRVYSYDDAIDYASDAYHLDDGHSFELDENYQDYLDGVYDE